MAAKRNIYFYIAYQLDLDFSLNLTL